MLLVIISNIFNQPGHASQTSKPSICYNFTMKLSINQEQLESVCNEQNISYLGLFGSQIRDEARHDSDVDILVDFSETKSYFELARAQQALQEVFKKDVDLVLRSNIKPQLRDNIYNDLTTLYEE